MQPSLLAEWFTVSRVGWMLVHSVWQASLIALLLAVAMFLLRHRSPQIRYLLACASLLLCLITPVTTVLITRPVSPVLAMENLPRTANGEICVPENAFPTPSLVQIQLPQELWFLQALERSIPYTVYAWGLGVAVLCLRMSVGFGRVQAWKSEGYLIVDDRWTGAMSRCARGLGLRKTVLLLQSQRVTVPMTLGFLRPVVLIPTSLATGLTPLQIQGILAHELAHIRRHDYLLNLVQTIIETLFFFHPAVRWMGGVLRQERENCCDDLASDLVGCPRRYAETLLRLEELCQQHNPLSLAITGGHLLPRIQRLLGKPASRVLFNGQLAAAMTILLGLLVIGCISKGKSANAASTTSVTFTEAPAECALVAGTRLDLLLTGSTNGTQSDLHVDRAGKIVVTDLGEVPVAGLTPTQAETEIENRFHLHGRNVTAQISVRSSGSDVQPVATPPHPPVAPPPLAEVRKAQIDEQRELTRAKTDLRRQLIEMRRSAADASSTDQERAAIEAEIAQLDARLSVLRAEQRIAERKLHPQMRFRNADLAERQIEEAIRGVERELLLLPPSTQPFEFENHQALRRPIIITIPPGTKLRTPAPTTAPVTEPTFARVDAATVLLAMQEELQRAQQRLDEQQAVIRHLQERLESVQVGEYVEKLPPSPPPTTQPTTAP